ncbi:hypothetical protein [Paracoccus marinaquae]|uniref:Uncharacterized protein n=1 Tax=Paracoccus marinaquae TaxID=2841926 RepID=A0ABS6AE97_9RHOB|nr:hypothetical protein [Paracoccus marinaquae]MBU3028925.1 hypothetical protein [Paracoccus marinaquae]
MRLQIGDAVFIPGRDAVRRGHLIWPVDCPIPFMENLTLDQTYSGDCRVADRGTTVYAGLALMRRRKQYADDVLVVLLPDVDIGQLSPDATIDLDPDRLE